jgi:hypothetical protein
MRFNRSSAKLTRVAARRPNTASDVAGTTRGYTAPLFKTAPKSPRAGGAASGLE